MKYVVILLSAAVFILSSCTSTTEPDREKFIIDVDSISAPQSINLNDTLRIQFWGIIGSNGCYSFGNFESNTSGEQLTITPWGYYTEAGACTDAIVELRGEEFKVVPEKKGTISIIISQPDEPITKAVVVK